MSDILFKPTESSEYDVLLANSDLSDVKEALRIIDGVGRTVTRRKKIERELHRREHPLVEKTRAGWASRFTDEWNKVRKAAGKI